MFNADYFGSLMSKDSEMLQDAVRILVKTRSGDEFAVYRIGAVHDQAVALFIYPGSGKPLPKIPKDERVEGGPSHRADLVVVPYVEIVQVHMSTGTLARKTPAGFGNK